MSALDVLLHDLVGLDAGGSVCSCGARQVSWLEHLGAVALESLGGGEKVRRPRPSRVDMHIDSDAEWAAGQQRKANLASFARQRADRWAALEPARIEEAA